MSRLTLVPTDSVRTRLEDNLTLFGHAEIDELAILLFEGQLSDPSDLSDTDVHFNVESDGSDEVLRCE